MQFSTHTDYFYYGGQWGTFFLIKIICTFFIFVILCHTILLNNKLKLNLINSTTYYNYDNA